MRDYQRKKQSKYILPKAVYHQSLWKIRDYYRLKEAAEDLMYSSNNSEDNTSRTNIPSDVVASTVVKRDKFLFTVDNIDKALIEIPIEYRKAIWDNIQYEMPYPIYADRSTYGRYKSKLIYLVADKLELI